MSSLGFSKKKNQIKRLERNILKLEEEIDKLNTEMQKFVIKEVDFSDLVMSLNELSKP